MRKNTALGVAGIVLAVACLACLSACQSQQHKALVSVQEELAARSIVRTKSMDLFERGQEANEKSKLDEARKYYTQAVEEDDRNSFAWMALGALEYKQEKYYEAASAFHRAARLEPLRYEPLFNIGLVMESAGLYSKAIPEYEAALKLAPDEVEVMEHLARCYLRTRTNLHKVRQLIDQASATECRPEWVRWLEQQSAKLNSEPLDTQARRNVANGSPPEE